MNAKEKKEKQKQYAKTYYDKNKKKLIAKTTAWQRAHPKRCNFYHKRWRDKNLEKAQAYSRAQYLKHKKKD